AGWLPAGGSRDRPIEQWAVGGLYLLRSRRGAPQPGPLCDSLADRTGSPGRLAGGLSGLLDPQLPENELQDRISAPGNAHQPALGAGQLARLGQKYWQNLAVAAF